MTSTGGPASANGDDGVRHAGREVTEGPVDAIATGSMVGLWPPEGRAMVVGVAGGSGSGKTTVVAAVVDAVGADKVAVLPHDAYYHDLSNLPMEQRRAANFDHPNAFDDDLFEAHLQALRAGQAVGVPDYDYVEYVRRDDTRTVRPRPIVIAEGILLFASSRLRDLLDLKVFVDTDDDLRLLRRLRRDISERGRSLDSVLDQYEATVRPMHLEFVEPSKRWADVLVPRGGGNRVAIDMLVRALGG